MGHGLDVQGNLFRFPLEEEIFSLPASVCPWSPLSLLFSEYRGTCSGSKAARAWSRPFTPIQYRSEEWWKLVRVVEQFWCSFPLKGPSDVLLFLGQPRKFAKRRSTQPRKERDKCTRKITRLNGTRMFVTVFTNVCPRQISRASWISSAPSRPFHYHFPLMFSRLRLPKQGTPAYY